jgi:hypothetical protein
VTQVISRPGTIAGLIVHHHLDVCDLLLPEIGLSDFRLVGGHEVVEVHDRVHKAVNDAQQGGMAARHVFGANVRPQQDSGVVIDMQERQMSRLFAQHKKHRVQQVKNLDRKVQVAIVDHGHCKIRRVVEVVEGLTVELVPAAPVRFVIGLKEDIF